jgi:hypothetical protein
MNKNLFIDFIQHIKPTKVETIVLVTAILICLFCMTLDYIKVM